MEKQIEAKNSNKLLEPIGHKTGLSLNFMFAHEEK
jgi:hypothetical protein